nr:MAG TPA: hypothetical protein [Crassvirales sp.]
MRFTLDAIPRRTHTYTYRAGIDQQANRSLRKSS